MDVNHVAVLQACADFVKKSRRIKHAMTVCQVIRNVTVINNRHSLNGLWAIRNVAQPRRTTAIGCQDLNGVAPVGQCTSQIKRRPRSSAILPRGVDVGDDERDSHAPKCRLRRDRAGEPCRRRGDEYPKPAKRL